MPRGPAEGSKILCIRARPAKHRSIGHDMLPRPKPRRLARAMLFLKLCVYIHICIRICKIQPAIWSQGFTPRKTCHVRVKLRQGGSAETRSSIFTTLRVPGCSRPNCCPIACGMQPGVDRYGLVECDLLFWRADEEFEKFRFSPASGRL